MINELPLRTQPVFPYHHKRYFEVSNSKVRVFGKCEVTSKNYEIFVPTDEFYAFLQGDKNIGVAMPSVPKEEREFLMTGTSPEGWKKLFLEC